MVKALGSKREEYYLVNQCILNQMKGLWICGPLMSLIYIHGYHWPREVHLSFCCFRVRVYIQKTLYLSHAFILKIGPVTLFYV